MLVPERGAMAELRAAVGPEWVRTYRGRLTAATLIEAMAWTTETPRGGTRLRQELDWDAIARATVRAYEAVATEPGRRVRRATRTRAADGRVWGEERRRMRRRRARRAPTPRTLAPSVCRGPGID